MLFHKQKLTPKNERRILNNLEKTEKILAVYSNENMSKRLSIVINPLSYNEVLITFQTDDNDDETINTFSFYNLSDAIEYYNSL